MKAIRNHSLLLAKHFLKLLVSPVFLILTVVGNGCVLIFAWLFYHLEHARNPSVDEPIDAIWWAFSTVTTVGFGDIVPISFYGRLLGIFLMLLGTAIFACYVALISDVVMRTHFESKKPSKE